MTALQPATISSRKDCSQQSSSFPVNGGIIVGSQWEKRRLRIRVGATLFRLLLKESGNPLRAFRAWRQLRAKYRRLFGQKMATKVARVGRRYYWRTGAPGFPSESFRQNLSFEIRRLLGGKSKQPGLRNLFLAITRKCPLQCKHCLEWNNLNGPEVLSREDLLGIVRKYQAFGVAQINFSGGEPLLRFKDLLYLLEQAVTGTDFWVITSGFSLTAEKACQLKSAGLTGLAVSIDDYYPEAQDRFRGREGAFDQAVKAVGYAREAGLCTALYLCPTREFLTARRLETYLAFARDLGVAFVQLLDPVAVGHYAGQDVALSPRQTELLEEVYEKYNNDRRYADFPIIGYQGHLQRRLGCFAAGNRFLYIDSIGQAQLCPFCRGASCDARQMSVPETLGLLRQSGCRAFKNTVE